MIRLFTVARAVSSAISLASMCTEHDFVNITSPELPCRIAFSKTGRIVTKENRVRLSAAQHREWKRALREHRRRAAAGSRAVDLCYALHHESGRSDLSNKRRFAASELGVTVLNALEEEIRSFAMEGVFLNAWLTLVFM